jgi:hypothetical protein
MNLMELYRLYDDQFALPRTRNPIEVLRRKLLRDALYQQITDELDRRIASYEEVS